MNLILLAASTSRDPTRTLVLRQRFAAQFRRRFREVERLTRQAILERDVFGERPVTQQLQPPPERAYAGQPPDQQINGFMAWFTSTMFAALTVPRRWWERSLRQGYLAGFKRGRSATGAPREAVPGVAPLPVQTPHWQALLNAFEAEMAAMHTQAATAMREVITRNITAPAQRIAQAANEALERSAQRSARIAQMAVVQAHATGTLDALELGGVGEVTADVEYVQFTTAGDARVCQRCRALSGRVYTIAEARGVIPLHMGCRCSWRAVRGRGRSAA